jgi:hypothetical protein
VQTLERQLHGRLRYRPADRALLPALSRLLARRRWTARRAANLRPNGLTDRPPRPPPYRPAGRRGAHHDCRSTSEAAKTDDLTATRRTISLAPARTLRLRPTGCAAR